ncbi:hypothetical protein ACVWYH_005115 [Bradyrhizobium sp. GM24.11]
MRQIEELTTAGRAQAFISSRSASILARVDPGQVRHFRLEPADRTARVRGVRLRDVDPDDELACLRAEEDLSAFLQGLRATMAAAPPSTAAAEALADQVLAFIDPLALARSFSEYARGEALDIALEAFRLHLAAYADGSPDWPTCLDRLAGVDQVPLMTVHKSKGLEYDTILFVGLDDATWWSHSAGNPEGLATFFVALSRAKQRAVFTFCRERGQRTRVADLYALLTATGVPEVAC